MRWALVIAVAVLASCAKAPPPKKVVEAPKPVDPQDAVKRLVADVYEALQAGDVRRFEALFTDDAMVFGLGPSDTFNSRDALIERVRQELLPLGLGGDALAVSHSRTEVGLGDGETSAYFYDLPKVTVTHRGKDSTWLPRITGHAVKDGDRWRIDALHVSLGVSDALLSRPDAHRLMLPPAPVADERGADTEELLGLTRRIVDDLAVKVARASERPGFVLIGTSPVELFEGGKTFKDLVRPSLPAIKKGGYVWKLDGPLRVRLAPDHRTGWAAGVLVLRIGSGKKAQVLPPFRALWVFAEEQGVWNLVSEHQSLAVKEDLREAAGDEELAAWQGLRDVALKRAAEAKRPPPTKDAPPKRESESKEDGAAPIDAW